MTRWLALVALATGLAGCDDPLFGSEFPITKASDDVDSFEADWAGVEAFSAKYCDSCHPALYPDLDLPEALHDAALDDADSLVVPYQPGSSLLWLIISGEDETGRLMPLGRQEPLPYDTIRHVRQWIEEGADVPFEPQ